VRVEATRRVLRTCVAFGSAASVSGYGTRISSSVEYVLPE
jgi:hypothetical protein